MLKMTVLAAALVVGTFEEGHEVGLRNGGLMADRVHKRVIAERGCAGLSQFQNTLNAVTARVRPPAARGARFTAGFYQGYVNALRDAIRKTREECGQRRFSDGIFPGVFLGNVFCQIAYEDPAALAEVKFGPIYDGWSSGADSLTDCDIAFSVVAADCGATGIAQQLLGSAQAASCAQ